jgi:hypothetical protein
MLSAIDSFVSMLNTELASAPPIHWVRVSPNEPEANTLKLDHLNFTVLSIDQRGPLEEILISLDLLSSDERQALTWMTTVRNVLIQQQYAKEKTYTPNPASPVETGKNISWDSDDVRFTVVASDETSVHLNATFPLTHARM